MLNETAGGGTTTTTGQPNHNPNLNILRQQSELSNPMGDDFNYEEFKS
jgi:catalase-peroxidase